MPLDQAAVSSGWPYVVTAQSTTLSEVERGCHEEGIPNLRSRPVTGCASSASQFCARVVRWVSACSLAVVASCLCMLTAAGLNSKLPARLFGLVA